MWLDCSENVDYSNNRIMASTSGTRVSPYNLGRSYGDCINRMEKQIELLNNINTEI